MKNGKNCNWVTQFLKLAVNLSIVTILLFSSQFALAKSINQSQPTKLNLTDSCHPLITENKTQYIIGYGSLMERNSKGRISPNMGISFPIRVKGFERGWMIHGSVYSQTTYLAVVNNKNMQMNAVIFSVNEMEIKKIDKREKGYCRVLVAPNQIKLLNGSIQSDAEIWIYAISQDKAHIPTPDFPIVQSYVDIVIKGCLQIERGFKLLGFAKECVTTTSNWSKYWINDRIFPRRPFIYEPKAAEIDKLLRGTVQSFFNQRVMPSIFRDK